MTDVPSSEEQYRFEPRLDFFHCSLIKEKKDSFLKDVWCIMCSVGHISKCQESVQTMHEILYNQMKLLLHEAEKVALLREGYSVRKVELIQKGFSAEEILSILGNKISEKEVLKKRKDSLLMRKGPSVQNLEIIHGDILFLMRRHRVKIKRLLDYLKVMDMKYPLKNEETVPKEPFDPNKLDFISHASRRDSKKKSVHWAEDSKLIEVFHFETNVTTERDEDSTSLVQNKNTRVSKCLQFFAEIEDCNEFTSILEESIVDVEMKRKLERIELITKFMTKKEHENFNQLIPEATFCCQGKQDKFKCWLLKAINIRTTDQTISPLALTILDFLAQETIINMVDMVFHIKSVRSSEIWEKDNSKLKKIFSVSSMKILDESEEDESGGDERNQTIDANVLGEGVLTTSLKNVFFDNWEKWIQGECELNQNLNIDAEDFSADFKNLYIYQSKITREEVIDAYMLFQMQRKPLLFLEDPFLKQTTLICLANVDDHKVPKTSPK